MSTRRPRLTDADWRVIRRALNDAMDERASYADAWHRDTPEHAAAKAQVEKYEALHRKLFGVQSARQESIEHFANLPSVSIFPAPAAPATDVGEK